MAITQSAPKDGPRPLRNEWDYGSFGPPQNRSSILTWRRPLHRQFGGDFGAVSATSVTSASPRRCQVEPIGNDLYQQLV